MLHLWVDKVLLSDYPSNPNYHGNALGMTSNAVRGL